MRTLLLILVLAAAPAVAAVPQSGAPGGDPPAAVGALTVAPGDPEVDRGVVEDPHGDRAVLLPTALTQPAGTVSISSYDLYFAGLTYGITDRLQVSATTLIPFLGATVVVGNVKWQALRQGPVRVALNAGGSYARISLFEPVTLPDGSREEITSQVMPHVGATASYCLTDDCHSLFSASAQVLTAVERGEAGQISAFFGASLVHRMTERIKLVLEIPAIAELHPYPGVFPGVPSTMALRYFRRWLALEGGAMYVGILLPYFAGSLRF